MLSHGITADGPARCSRVSMRHVDVCAARKTTVQGGARRAGTRGESVGGVIDEAAPVTVSLHLYKLFVD